MARACFDDTKVFSFVFFLFNVLFDGYCIGCCSLFSLLRTYLGRTIQGAVLIKNLAAKEPSALGLETYYKQYYLCLAAAAASIKWYYPNFSLLLL